MISQRKLRPEEVAALILVSVTPTDRALDGWSCYGEEDIEVLGTYIHKGGSALLAMLHSYANNVFEPPLRVAPVPDREGQRR